MKLWEILPQLKEGQSIKVTYKSGTSLQVTYMNGCLRQIETRAPFSLFDYNLEADYELIPQSVPFEEALKALKEGEEIYCMLGRCKNIYYGVDNDFSIYIREILEGTWYICS